MWKFVPLPDRSFIAVTGRDRPAFLQSLITQNIDLLQADNPLLYSALLTPQGKYLYDFFLWYRDECILIETDAARRDEFMALLAKYKLRKDVGLEAFTQQVYQIFHPTAHARPLGSLPTKGCEPFMIDPRHPDLGYRSLVKPDLPQASPEEWTAHRLQYNVPDCPHDLRIGLSTPFEGNIDLLNGIDFNKGCYMGQEMVSRIHHRGLVKRRFPDL